MGPPTYPCPSPSCSFKKVYTGRSHGDTLIKNAKFIGQDIITTGSDSGHLFFYDKNTTEIINVIKSDSTIANVVLPHPLYESSCIATSGIDSNVKIYTPFESEVSKDANYYDGEVGSDEIFRVVTLNTKHALMSQLGDISSNSEVIANYCLTS